MSILAAADRLAIKKPDGERAANLLSSKATYPGGH
jgi:hypothetical protein